MQKYFKSSTLQQEDKAKQENNNKILGTRRNFIISYETFFIINVKTYKSVNER